MEDREEGELDGDEKQDREDGGEDEEAAEEGAESLLPLRPSALAIQLALERLCEDQSREDPSESDDSLLEPNPEHHEESISRLHSPGKIVNELFKEAKEHGAITAEEASKSTENLFKAKSFSGGGYKLGDSSVKQSEYICDDELFTGGPDVQILLKLWSNGFSLDDGQLRSYSEPENARFLDSIKRGEIPVELQHMVHSSQVSLDMEDHQDQEYIKPRLKFKAFSGEGKKLGSLTPEIISTPSSPEEEHKSFLNADVELDGHVPTTKIQIRLADGTRLIQRFNLSHRIMDVRAFIIQSRPEFAQTDFTLITTFPNMELTEEIQTLEEADLLNTVLLQRLK